MAVLRAFKAIRPTENLASKVAALPYDVMNTEEARVIGEKNELSFVHIDKAQIDLEKDVDQYSTEVYEKAKENLYSMIKKGIFVKDNKKNLYIYRQIMNGRIQTGIVGCTSIDDYINGVIKKHEFTLPSKEKDRINHVDYCNSNTGPIFLTYRSNNRINEIVDEETKKKPVYDFISDDGISHIVWIINDDQAIKEIELLFGEIDALYIADGHHRAASAVKVGLKRREDNPGYTGDEEFNFFLSVVFPDTDLTIMDYNRVVKDLNGMTVDKLVNNIKDKFEIEKVKNKEPYKPKKKHEFGMYVEGKWYRLTAKKGTFNELDPVLSLDVSILQNNLLEPVLNINDPRENDRIEFIGGIRGLEELERRVNTDMKIAFSMYPTTIQDLMGVADSNKVMPPKSTWFEPKLRSGLFIHELK
ncbi:uncharacterized protein (DUF1015 family) [Clostridium acetobutylicum]|uniref:Related to HTH domain of SpoOJ/ParA/ParB/repB family, involved in chromosome partitioning n=1 Tax=Clostridium acetobutylicum (strain ATCC 824 / DSM 792 / JCM 1419 / IAM 19013 / LMG 5710 / NBRC 13948 / NRRL B-527 / VKM B-1787 / 2291 / W) TaxID=272562 RepID=Q97N22_CLOAB|nr:MULTISPECIES: DUF1015 domain-containing protein [Clostridium]AAK78003.1 Related to HTH domain of SpoOJ/ParA/ParB/repB family, involved in chromosome partitioning [Clostridium acetobutylicum ATCC 824]ADZ19059.1 HTH domain of SpoOJ/ParA/ParB/repB family [Clostridium acetobutylicum EA 2018]AEI31014.1 SpoOJ/ParA/ParB/repB family protein [Clostridium acetobutylicum DSM 1731]AWV81934.1 DUF1015 domain-containing protein [Clostridium acetobutylicum]MBC2395484.1 DUF1015 domain-containing protein [Cl